MKYTVLLLLLIAGIPHVNSQSMILPADQPTRKNSEVFQLDRSAAALGISPEVIAKTATLKNPPVNIAVFGVDRRNKVAYGNADMIMILSVDQLTKKLKLSSIMRDTYVNISGQGMNKINSAYATGGPQLAIKTLNENFNMDIKDYVSIDFFGSARVIDALGGVTLNVKAEEVPHLNNYLNEIAAIEMTESVKIPGAGVQKLDGKQTVAYTRIRAVGNNDYERTERQRVVMSLLSEKIRRSDPSSFSSLAFEILPHLETSMSKMTLFSLGAGILDSKNTTIQQARFPTDTNRKGIVKDGIWYLSTDLKKTSNSLHQFIYQNIQP
ncbi:MAG TPA: LCP family protein [Sphingobacteriaceae bacterium]